MRKIVTLLPVLVLLCASAFGQNRPITGQVTDENGNPVPFASIKIKNTNTGTSANAIGEFTINAKTGDVLTITAVNFKPREVSVTAASSVSASLTKSTDVIDEVVVTAQGIRKKPREIG